MPAVDSLLSEEEWALWDRGAARMEETLEALGRAPAVFGLIHADLHFNNLVLSPRGLVPIDFDDGGWGYYAGDLCIPLGQLQKSPQPERRREAFLSGYARIRPVPEAPLLQMFGALDALMIPRWLAARQEMERARARAPEILRTCTQRIRAYLEG